MNVSAAKTLIEQMVISFGAGGTLQLIGDAIEEHYAEALASDKATDAQVRADAEFVIKILTACAARVRKGLAE